MSYGSIILAEPSVIAFVPCTEVTGPNQDVIVGDTNTVSGTAPTYGVPTTSLLGGRGTQLSAAGTISWTNPLHALPATDFSVEGWFNSTSANIGPDESPLLPGAQLIGADISGPSNDWALCIIGNSQPLMEVGNPDFTKVTATGAYNDGNWHYAVGTYTQATGVLKLYVDAVLIGSSTTSNPGGKNGFTSFSAGLGTYGWVATICNLAIYSSALSQAQITAHWNAGTVPSPTTAEVFGAFATDKVFPPIMLANVKGIKPRIYVPIENNTVSTRQ